MTAKFLFLDPAPFQSQKSFSKKAVIQHRGDEILLRSYVTYVAIYNTKEQSFALSGYYSPTTAKHINAFLHYCGFDITLSKIQIEKQVIPIRKHRPQVNRDIAFTRINNDVNGNPRFVCHFLNLLTEEENQSTFNTSEQYEIAIHRAKKLGGKKYHNKSYGGGIAFTSYSTTMQLEQQINDLVSDAITVW